MDNKSEPPVTQRNIELSPSRFDELEKKVFEIDGKLDQVMKTLEGAAKLPQVMKTLEDIANQFILFQSDVQKEKDRNQRIERKLGFVRCIKDFSCDNGNGPEGFNDEPDTDSGVTHGALGVCSVLPSAELCGISGL